MDFNVWATCPKCNKLHVISINIQRNGLLEPIMPSFNMNCENCNCEFTVQTTLKIETVEKKEG
jgi:transposase-like protein